MSGDLRLLDLLHKLGHGNVAEYGNYYRTRPLYRPSDNNFVLSIRKNDGSWYDFKTKQHGSIYDLIQIINPTLADQIRDSKAKLDFANFSYDSDSIPEIKIDFSVDDSYLSRLEQDHSYWNNRGVDNITLEPFRGGVSKISKMYGRYVFPIFNDRNKIIGVAGRDLGTSKNQSFRPKWKLIGNKQQWCYPSFLNDKDITDECYLVESIGDMLFLRQAGIYNVLVVFGTEINKQIILYLLKKHVKRIFVSFNNDEPQEINGRMVRVGNESAENCRDTLLGFFDESQVFVKLPPVKDFGEMSSQEIISWQKN